MNYLYERDYKNKIYPLINIIFFIKLCYKIIKKQCLSDLSFNFFWLIWTNNKMTWK